MSNIRQIYHRVLVPRLPWLLLASFLASALAYGVAASFVPDHQVHFSYIVSLSQREDSPDFRFDGYYAFQATDLFAATLAKWLQTPEVISEAHRVAELALSTHDPRAVRRLVLAEKTAPQLIEVTVRARDAAYAQQLSAGLTKVLESYIDRYHQESIPGLTFRVTATDSWVGTPVVATKVIAIAVFIFTFFAGLNLILFFESMPTSGGSSRGW